jgi:hypothetical protein
MARKGTERAPKRLHFLEQAPKGHFIIWNGTERAPKRHSGKSAVGAGARSETPTGTEPASPGTETDSHKFSQLIINLKRYWKGTQSASNLLHAYGFMKGHPTGTQRAPKRIQIKCLLMKGHWKGTQTASIMLHFFVIYEGATNRHSKGIQTDSRKRSAYERALNRLHTCYMLMDLRRGTQQAPKGHRNVLSYMVYLWKGTQRAPKRIHPKEFSIFLILWKLHFIMNVTQNSFLDF